MSIFGIPFDLIGGGIDTLFRFLDFGRVEEANQRELDRRDEASGNLIAGGIDLAEQFQEDSPFRNAPTLDEALGFFGGGADSLRGFLDKNQFTQNTNIDDFQFDASNLTDLSSDIVGRLGDARLQPGSLAQQVNFPDFSSNAFLTNQLGRIAEASEGRETLQRQNILSSNIASNRSLAEAGSQLDRAQFTEAQQRGRASTGAESAARELEVQGGLQQAGIQGALASTEAQINAALDAAIASNARQIGLQQSSQGQQDIETRLGASLTQDRLGFDDITRRGGLEGLLAELFSKAEGQGSGLFQFFGAGQSAENAAVLQLLAQLLSQSEGIRAGTTETIPLLQNIAAPLREAFEAQADRQALRDSGGGGGGFSANVGINPLDLFRLGE